MKYMEHDWQNKLSGTGLSEEIKFSITYAISSEMIFLKQVFQNTGNKELFVTIILCSSSKCSVLFLFFCYVQQQQHHGVV